MRQGDSLDLSQFQGISPTQSLRPHRNIKKRTFKRFMIWIGIIGFIALCLTFLILLLRSKQTTNLVENEVMGLENLDNPLIPKKSVILRNTSGLFIDGVNSHMITLLTIRDISAINLTSESFPNLKSLIIEDPGIKSLSLDSNLKIDSLTIKGSNLTVFNYNSTELLNLFLLSNPLMTEFSNSNLPSLETLNITQTPLSTWSNNQFGTLQLVEVSNADLILPRVDTKIATLRIYNCTKDYLQIQGNIVNLKIEYSEISFKVENNAIIESIEISNTTVTDVALVNCSKVLGISFNILNQINSLKIINCLKFDYLNNTIDVKQVQISGTNLTNLSSLKNISSILIEASPIKAFSLEYLPDLSYVKKIRLDYSKVQQMTNISFPAYMADELFLKNYNGTFNLSTLKGNSLRNLTLVECRMPSLPIFNLSQQLSVINFSRVFLDQSMYLYQYKLLKSLDLYDSNIKTIQSIEVNGTVNITLSSVVLINSSRFNVSSFFNYNTNSLDRVQLCTFTLFGEEKKLTLYGNGYNATFNQNSGNVIELQLIRFKYMYGVFFYSLKVLHVDNSYIDFNDLLDELKKMKSRGINLTTIYIVWSASVYQRNQIALLFPGIVIV